MLKILLRMQEYRKLKYLWLHFQFNSYKESAQQICLLQVIPSITQLRFVQYLFLSSHITPVCVIVLHRFHISVANIREA